MTTIKQTWSDVAIQENNIQPVLDKYFPAADGWRIIFKRNRSGSFCYTNGKVRCSEKIVWLYSHMFLGDNRDKVIHTIIHEYAHYFQYVMTGHSQHDRKFWEILSMLEVDENCKYTQKKEGTLENRLDFVKQI